MSTNTKPRPINTRRLGKLTRTSFKQLVKNAGTQAALARELEVPLSTVRNWKRSLYN